MAQLKDLLVNGRSVFLDLITITGAKLASGGSDNLVWNTNGGTVNITTVNDGKYIRKDTDDSTAYQVEFTKTDRAIKVGSIAGRTIGGQTGEYIHMYDRVHIGSPSGWGSRNAPQYGLSVYGGAWLATDTGNVGIGTSSPNTNYKLNVVGSSEFLNSYVSINADTYGSSCPNRVTISAGLPFGSAYTSSGLRLFSNGLGIRDPYCGVTSGSGSNDTLWIRMVEETSNQGWAEIATGDDGTEPIYVRQYNTSSAIVNSVTLLDGNGNTSFPKNIGIGTQSPSEKLTVKGGNIKVEASSSTAGCTMQYDATEECMKFTFA